MMKRNTSLLLIILLLVSILTGCGIDDLGYLKLSKEINQITSFDFNSSVDLEVSKAVLGEKMKFNIAIEGKADVKNLDSPYFDMDLKININGKEHKNPVKFIMSENKLYVSKNAILELINIQENLGYEEYNKKALQQLYRVNLKDVNYILLADVSDIYGNIDYTTDSKDISDHAHNYIVSAFKGFDSKLVTKINNGYSVELTSEKIVDFIERFIQYLSENKDLVFDETIKYIENIYDIMDIQAYDESMDFNKEEIIAELEEVRQDFYDFIDGTEFMQSYFLEEFSSALDRSYFKGEITKKGTTYLQSATGQLVIEDVIVGILNTTTEITPATIKKVPISGDSIFIEDVIKLYEDLEIKYNPVESIKITWHSEDYNDSIYANISIYKKDGTFSWDYADYLLLEDRVYLPLRFIGEKFNEDVQWDDVAKKAYIIRDNEPIYMIGELVEDTTMVKIRDFEKLGYTIHFEQENGPVGYYYSTATIIKP